MDEESPVPFYLRSPEERVAMTRAAMREGRTLVARWAALDASESAPWSARSALAAEWLCDQPRVADLGCGHMALERWLRPDQTYVPVDVLARDARTLVCDLNHSPPPETGATGAACLGLLEYLHDPAGLLKRLAVSYQCVVLSYCVVEAPDAPPERREHGWVNEFDSPAIESLFHSCGLVVARSRWVGRLQRLWRLEPRTGPIVAISA